MLRGEHQGIQLRQTPINWLLVDQLALTPYIIQNKQKFDTPLFPALPARYGFKMHQNDVHPKHLAFIKNEGEKTVCTTGLHVDSG